MPILINALRVGIAAIAASDEKLECVNDSEAAFELLSYWDSLWSKASRRAPRVSCPLLAGLELFGRCQKAEPIEFQCHAVVKRRERSANYTSSASRSFRRIRSMPHLSCGIALSQRSGST